MENKAEHKYHISFSVKVIKVLFLGISSNSNVKV